MAVIHPCATPMRRFSKQRAQLCQAAGCWRSPVQVETHWCPEHPWHLAARPSSPTIVRVQGLLVMINDTWLMINCRIMTYMHVLSGFYMLRNEIPQLPPRNLGFTGWLFRRRRPTPEWSVVKAGPPRHRFQKWFAVVLKWWVPPNLETQTYIHT